MSRGNLSRAGSIISASELSRASTGNALGSRSSGSTRSRRRKKVDKILYLCTDHDAMSCEKILDTLVEKSIIEKTTPMPTWFPIQVPMRAPRSDAEALDWSQSYWPCFYRPSNDYGPWITIVERAAAEILSRVNLCVQVARDAGKASQLACHGLNSACVIVENGQIICVRGDARFMGLTAGEGVRPDGSRSENILGHAAMRAIGQVGRLRVAAATVTPEKPTDESRDVMGDLTNSMRNSSLKQLANLPNDFLENPISSIERKYDQNSAVDGSGYLCLDMEAYLTHEPCLMCCMAMVHSRIRRVIFAKRMPKTGGLTADERATGERGDAKEANSLGYGLWYRKELNWRQLAWEWRDFLSHQSYDDGVDRDVHV